MKLLQAGPMGLFIFLSIASLAQTQIKSQHISIAEGLSDRFATDLVQDHYGFLWIGTRNGLNRYDGARFLVYNTDADNPNKLHSNQVWRLFLDGKDTLVIFNDFQALDILNIRTNKVTRVNINQPTEEKKIREIQQMQNGEIYMIAEDENGYALLQYKHQAIKVIWEVKEPRKTNPEITDLESVRFNFFLHKNGFFWIHDRENGLIWLAPKENGKGYAITRKFLTKDFEGRESDKSLPFITNFLVQDKFNRILMAFDELPGIYQYDTVGQRFVQSPNFDQELFYKKASTDQVGNTIVTAWKNSKIPYYHFLMDKRDQLWDYSDWLDKENSYLKLFGNDFQRFFIKLSFLGLETRAFSPPEVERFLGRTLSPDQLGINIRGMQEDEKGNIIVSTEKSGWFLISNNKETTTEGPLTINHQRSNVEPLELKTPPLEDLNPPQFCRSLIKDESGQIWTSIYKKHYAPDPPGGYLMAYDPRTGKVETYTSRYRMECLAMSQNGQFWVSGVNKVQLFDTKTHTFSTYFNADGSEPMHNREPSDMMQSRDGLIWIATNTGLLKIDPIRKHTTVISNEIPPEKGGLSTNHILALHEATDGKIWIGTYGGGFNVLDRKRNIVEVYTEDTGLANNYICGFIPDENGNQWIGTFNGLSYFDQKQKSFRNFYTLDGFNSNEFNRFAFFRDSEDYLYLGGINGLNRFRSEELLQLDSTPTPWVFLSEISFFDEEQKQIVKKQFALQELQQIVLPAENRYLSLKFGLSDYTQMKLNRFAYFLEGYDLNWNQLGNRSELTFNNLPPGQYTLHLKGANYRGYWTPEEIQIPIVVNEFFYKSWWFLLSIFVLILGSILIFYRYRLNQVMRLMHIRTRIASDLHDDVGGMLAGIAMQAEVLELSQGPVSKEKLKHIRELSHNALSSMRDVVWSIDSRRDKVVDLLDRMREHAEETLVPSNIQYAIESYGLEPEKKLSTEVRRTLYLIFKEAITNTVRHADATFVEVRFGNLENRFEMILSDNGQTVSTSIKSTGLGLENMKLRAQKIKATLDLSTEKGFTIVLRRSML